MKISEKTYYPIFEKWLQNRGYTSTYSSVTIWLRQEVDIIGIKYFKTVEPHIATIEVKMRDWNKVRYQAVRRANFADFSYMGLVMNGSGITLGYFIYKLSSDLPFLKKYGIGVLVYDEVRKKMFQVLSAQRQTNRLLLPKKEIIEICKEFEKDRAELEKQVVMLEKGE